MGHALLKEDAYIIEKCRRPKCEGTEHKSDIWNGIRMNQCTTCGMRWLNVDEYNEQVVGELDEG